MIKYRRFVCNPLEENTYVVWDEASRETAIVDCGAFTNGEKNDIASFIEEEHLHPTLALQTHMHFDHLFGLGWLKEKYGIRPMCHELEQKNYDMQEIMASDMFGVKLTLDRPGILRYIKDGEKMRLGESELTVIHTPGHSPGGVCYLADTFLLSGDTLFAGSCGRADLPGGNMQDEIRSIKERLITLREDITVLPGHGPETTIAREKRYWI